MGFRGRRLRMADLPRVAHEAWSLALDLATGASRRRLSVAALIRDQEGRILLAENAVPRSRWGLPGGRLERHEEPAAGLAREVSEETGLEVEVVELRAVVVRPTLVVLVFACHVLGGILRPAPVEIAALAWVDEAEALRRLPPPGQAHLRAALAGGSAGLLVDRWVRGARAGGG